MEMTPPFHRFVYSLPFLLAVAPVAEAVIALDASTAGNFTALGLGGPSDPVADNQANRVDIELVGDEAFGLSAFYLAYDSGSMFFRVRVSGENGKADGVQNGYTYVGIDVTGDGAVNYWIEHGGSPSQSISLRYAGVGANDSPSTTDLGAVASYLDGNGDRVAASEAVSYFGSPDANSYFAEVASIDAGLSAGAYDLDGRGDPDMFLTFAFDFSMLQAVVREDAAALSSINPKVDYTLFDEDFAIQLLLVTSQNGNNINSDFGGLDDNVADPSVPFAEQPTPGGGTGGGLTGGIDATGEPKDFVPEPAAYALFLGLAGLVAAMGRRFSGRGG